MHQGDFLDLSQEAWDRAYEEHQRRKLRLVPGPISFEQAKAQFTPEQREKLKGLVAARWQHRGQDTRRSEVPLAMDKQ